MQENYLVKDVMSYTVATFDKRDKLIDAIHIMADSGVQSILIVEKGLPIGILTVRDLMQKILGKGKDYKKIKCGNIMASVRTVRPDDTITYISKLMKELRRKRFPVIENGRIVGVINQEDIVNLSHVLHKKHRTISIHHKIQMSIVVLVILFLASFFVYNTFFV